MNKYELSKHARYRLKLAENGLCPRCGKVSFPYYLCDIHRAYLNLHRALRTLLRLGIVRQDSLGRYGHTGKEYNITEYKINKDDRRKLPRVNNIPLDAHVFEEIVLKLLDERQEPISQAELKKHLKEVFKQHPL